MRFDVSGSGDFFMLKDYVGWETKDVHPGIESFPLKWVAYDDDGKYCGEGFLKEKTEDNYHLLLYGVAAQWGATRVEMYDRGGGRHQGTIE